LDPPRRLNNCHSYTADALYTLCRLPAGTAPSENQTHTNYFLSSRWRVCLRRYGLYFMSSTRWEVLRRFCGKMGGGGLGRGASSVGCSMDGRREPGVGGRGDRAGRDASFAARDTRGTDGTTPSTPPRGLLNLARNQSPRHRVSVRWVKNAAYPQPLMGELWMLRIVLGRAGAALTFSVM